MGNSYFGEKDSIPNTTIPVVFGAEDESQIRLRFGKYGLGKLFDAGGVISVPDRLYITDWVI